MGHGESDARGQSDETHRYEVIDLVNVGRIEEFQHACDWEKSFAQSRQYLFHRSRLYVELDLARQVKQYHQVVALTDSTA